MTSISRTAVAAVPATRIRFTGRSIAAVACPPDRQRVVVRDDEIRGLEFHRFPTGGGSFYVCARVGGSGRVVRVRLGGHETPVESIRKLAREATVKLDQGTDPVAERRTARGMQTFREAFDAFVLLPTKRSRLAKGEKTIHGYRQQFDAHLAGLANRPLDGITRDDIAAVHRKVSKTAPTMANRVVALAHAVYESLPRLNFPAVPNPARAISRNVEREVVRFFSDEELARFRAALEAEVNPDFRDVVLVLMGTGARKGAVLAMRWGDLNLDAGIWTHAPERSKGRRVTRIALAGPVVDLLRRRHDERTSDEFVFPSHGASGHLRDPRPSWKALLARAKIERFRVHDLRHAFASMLAMQHVPMAHIKSALGHASMQSTQRYAHLADESVRAEVNRAAVALLPAPAKPGPKAKRTGRKSTSAAKGGDK